MDYATMLSKGIISNNLSLAQVCFRLAKRDIWIDKAILSKMQNGKLPPAKDNVNKVLADVLGIDETKFRLAAAKELIPVELYELIRQAG